MKKLTNNTELNAFVANMNPSAVLHAIRTKGEIEIFESKSKFNKAAKANPTAVQGEFTVYNFVWYRF